MKYLKTFESKINPPQTAKTVDRDKQKLYLNNRVKIADLLRKSDIPDSEFKERFDQLDKQTAIKFIENGSPSQYYFEEILNMLGESGIDISEFII